MPQRRLPRPVGERNDFEQALDALLADARPINTIGMMAVRANLNGINYNSAIGDVSLLSLLLGLADRITVAREEIDRATSRRDTPIKITMTLLIEPADEEMLTPAPEGELHDGPAMTVVEIPPYDRANRED